MEDIRLNWTDNGLNSHGIRVLTEGIDTSRFDKNPIMLYNHHRTTSGKVDEILPIGKWKDYRKEPDGRMTAVPVFDMNDEFAAKIASKVYGGFLTACSISVFPLEVSDDPQYKLPGQTGPTVVLSELRESSIADIPSNPNSAGLVLCDYDGNVLELTDGGNSLLRLYNNQNQTKMKELALKLGLQEGASEAAMMSAVLKLQADHQQEVKTLTDRAEKAENDLASFKRERDEAQRAEALMLVDAAIKDGRVSVELKDEYLAMFADNFERTRKIVAGTTSARSGLGRQVAGQKGTVAMKFADKSWDELDKAGLLAELKLSDPDLYNEKYKEMAAGLKIRA
jgi:hypothetical protein